MYEFSLQLIGTISNLKVLFCKGIVLIKLVILSDNLDLLITVQGIEAISLVLSVIPIIKIP